MKIVQIANAGREIDRLKKRKVVVFAGSGVSIWEPTTLPSGVGVTNAVWDTLIASYAGSTDGSSLLEDLKWEFPFEHLFEVCPNLSRAFDLLTSLYNCREANPVHNAIAKTVEAGLVSHVITTNYDHCFETAFGGFPGIPLRIVIDEDQAASTSASNKEVVLFKVHGTADPGLSNLIFTLRNEGLLPSGKRNLLRKLMANSVCLFVGYSGLDFDLCPLIGQFEGVEVFWNGREPKPKTTNARNLLEKTNGTYISGDMLEVIAKWTGVNCDAKLSSNVITTDDVRRAFTNNELTAWRVALFNALGFPKMALAVIAAEGGTLTEGQLTLQTSRSLFYAGKYLQASNSYTSLAKLYARKGHKKSASSVWLDTSDSFRAGGYFVRAWGALIWGKWSSPDYDQAKFYLKKSLLISNLLEGLDAVKAPRVLRQMIKSYLGTNLNLCMRLSIEQGSLHDFQQVGFLAEKHLIDLDSQGLFSPTKAAEGYQHLGYYHAEIMAFNEVRRRQDFSTLSTDDILELLKTIDRYVSHSQLTGQNSSIWKLLAIKKRLIYETGYGSFSERSTLFESLNACEYSKLMKRSQTSRFQLQIK